MALWTCVGCTAAYSVDAPRCPQCGSTEYVEDGVMPKITVHGGATNAALDAELAAQAEAQAAVDAVTDVVGEEQDTEQVEAVEDAVILPVEESAAPPKRAAKKTAAPAADDPAVES